MSVAPTLSTYLAWSRYLLLFSKENKLRFDDLIVAVGVVCFLLFLFVCFLLLQMGFSIMLFSRQMHCPKQCVTAKTNGTVIHKKQA